MKDWVGNTNSIFKGLHLIDKNNKMFDFLNSIKIIQTKEHIKNQEIEIGNTFKELTVIYIDNKKIYCRCSCGNIVSSTLYPFSKHKYISCGCKKHVEKHNMSRTKIYGVWKEMNLRCDCETNCNYHKYGAKGIQVCEEWKRTNPNGFTNFLKWSKENGYTEGLTIDRIDEKSDYTPTNCRWTTFLIQNTHLGMLKNNTSGYKGVSWSKNLNKWIVVISINNKSHRVGAFNTKKEAVEGRNKYIDEHHLLHEKQEYIGEEGYKY